MPTTPELIRNCQCRRTVCPCVPCPNAMDEEDLQCSDCRAVKKSGGFCCHKADGEPVPIDKDIEEAWERLNRRMRQAEVSAQAKRLLRLLEKQTDEGKER